MLAIIVLIVMGLVSVIGSEMLSVVALTGAPSRFDLTNDSIVLIMAPVVLGIFYLLFWRERT